VAGEQQSIKLGATCTCHDMPTKRERRAILEKELDCLLEIQERLVKDLNSDQASYSSAKQHSNLFERLSRKYSLAPTQFAVRKTNGAIIKIRKGITQGKSPYRSVLRGQLGRASAKGRPQATGPDSDKTDP
jgi:hypothetical protein